MKSGLSGKQWFYGALGLLVVVTLGLVVASQYEWVDEPVPRQLKGEAKRDNFYAARLLMQKLGYQTRVVNDPAALVQQPTGATIAMLNYLPSPPGKDLGADLIAWARRGGHLVVVGDHLGEEHAKALGLTSVGSYQAERSTGEHTGISSVLMENRRLGVALGHCNVFRLNTPAEWTVTVPEFIPHNTGSKPGKAPDSVLADVPAAARLRLGQGSVTVLCSQSPLTNPLVERADNAEFVVRALTREGHDTIVFAPAPDYPGLGEWLLTHAWSAVIAALLLLALLLWRYMPRFGPVTPLPPAVRPGLRQHLAAVASFHLRKQLWRELLQASRDAVTRLAERHAGTRHFRLDDIAALAGVSAAELERALNTPPQDKAAYLRHAATLATVSDALHAARPLSSSYSSRSRKP